MGDVTKVASPIFRKGIYMKKFVIFVLAVALPVILAGCGPKKEEEAMDKAPTNMGGGKFNNEAPGANSAPAAPGAGEGVPRPGGGGKRKGAPVGGTP